MEYSRYKEVESIFVEVVDLPEPERAESIQRLTSDEELIESVTQLLREHERLLNEEFLEQPIIDLSSESELSSNAVPPPSQIKGYSIIRLLGEGTSSTVYLAKSPLPLERLVAIKLVNVGAGKQTLARFYDEQRVLAQIRYPGIAEVYDEGTTDDRRPFTVLEFVDGAPITQYCTSHDLEWRDIVRLLIQCCTAVAHAHQHNIIHRDLKPTNLIVADTDGTPTVKVIDFGIAKLLDPYLAPSQSTLDSQFVGTLPYASPEQVSGSFAPDTRTDVHALGVVLYECLAGEHPFFREGVGLKVAIDTILNTPIPRLQSTKALPTNELNAILSLACAKEPSDRYSSLTHFSEDLQRLLDGLPVRAMDAKPMYVTGKLISKYRLPVAITLLSLIVVSWLIALAISNGFEAERNRQALQDTAIRMVDDLMPKLSDLSGSTEARKELAATLGVRIDDLLRSNPEDEELLIRKARILEYQSDIELADGRVENALNLRTQASSILTTIADSSERLQDDQLRLQIKLGDIDKVHGDYESARIKYLEVHGALLQSDADRRTELCWSHERLAHVSFKLHDLNNAYRHARSRLDLAERLLLEHPDSSSQLRNCAIAHQAMAELYNTEYKYQEAMVHAVKTLEYSSRLIQISPDSFASQHMLLNAQVIHVFAQINLGETSGSEEAARQIVSSAFLLIERNPSRKDASDIAWKKLYALHGYFLKRAPQLDRALLIEAMIKINPDRSFK